MPVEVTFVLESSTAIAAEQADHHTNDTTFQLIDKRDFIRMAPLLNPEMTWDRLLGHHPDEDLRECGGLNPLVHYLTVDSCEMILKHLPLFTSGIDLQHLPAGFFFAKNPMGGGGCDVLHYNEYMKTHQEPPTPLAICLSDKSISEELLRPVLFEAHQERWYQFLESNRGIHCTATELHQAFIYFSEAMRRLGLVFYEPNVEVLSLDFNPIVLLGRWMTVMTNPHLKMEDRAIQWSCLTQLPLAKSHEAIRAITDYENQEHPCGFLLPEMRLDEKGFTAFKNVSAYPEIVYGFRTVMQHKDILVYDITKDECSFWRFVAFQTKRNTLAFYQRALERIKRMPFMESETVKDEKEALSRTEEALSNNPDNTLLQEIYQSDLSVFCRICSHQADWSMRRMLAASTTRDNHSSNLEDADQEKWEALCELLDTIREASLLMVLYEGGSPGRLKRDVVAHLARLREPPNIVFLNEITGHIRRFVSTMSLGLDPLAPLRELSDQLSVCIETHGLSFYQGARFYFINNTWEKLNIQKYVELYYFWIKTFLEKSKYFAPHLSTFCMLTEADVRAIAAVRISDLDNPMLALALRVLTEMEYPPLELRPQHLIDLLQYIDENRFEGDPLMETLAYLEARYSRYFLPGYFDDKRAQLQIARLGLTAAQQDKIRRCRFSAEQTNHLISIESCLVMRNQAIEERDLDALNDACMRLRQMVQPADFTLFLERLDEMKAYLPRNTDVLHQLLIQLSEKRSLEDVSQFFLQNKIERCHDEDFVEKCLVFIQDIKPLSLKDLSFDRLRCQEVLASIVLNTRERSEDYTDDIDSIIQELNLFSKEHPHLKKYLLEAIHHVPNKNTSLYFTNLMALKDTFAQLRMLLQKGNEHEKKHMIMLYSLLAHFYQKPTDLTTLVGHIKVLETEEQQRFILSLVCALLDNQQSIEGLAELIALLKEHPHHYTTLSSVCVSPPYPDFSTMSSWLQGDFTAQYGSFCQNPFGDRLLAFAFDRAIYDVKCEAFGLEMFTPELGDLLNAALTNNRGLSVSALGDRLRAPAITPLDRLCLSIELLSRTASQRHGDRQISQECNTTQVMALTAMLTHPNKKLISEIDTGEGKSRIMMILAANLALQGKTVDFITSDMQLAERDYLQYKQFFSALGVRTGLVSLDTPAELYQKNGGVNFSDNAQLLLLRNQCDVTGSTHAFRDERASECCLLIDEFDKFRYDKSHDAYNFAVKSKRLAGFIWIYPLLMAYMSDYLSNAVGEPNCAELVDAFCTYVERHHAHLEHKASLNRLKTRNRGQLTTWLHAAYMASQMKEDIDYKLSEVDEDKWVAVRDADGHLRYSRKVLVLDGGRPSESSTFSEGVHQCLCAKENSRLGQESFVILPENETQRSAFPQTFMDSYQGGTLFGVSGTARAAAPLADASINYEQFAYLQVPREKKLIREDKSTWFTKDSVQQIEVLKRVIAEKASKGLPTLLICKNETQSRALHEALAPWYEELGHQTKWVHGLTHSSEEKQAIHQAGDSTRLTISTAGLFGRGVDIHADNLFVASAYVPTLEDTKQIQGRTARAGKPGEFRMILNVSDLTTSTQGTTYSGDNEVYQQQLKQAFDHACVEEINNLYGVFQEEITLYFFNTLHRAPLVDKATRLAEWQTFLRRMQEAWRECAVELEPFVRNKFYEPFKQSFQAFTESWRNQVPKDDFPAEPPSFNDERTRAIYNGLQGRKTFFASKRLPIRKRLDYDPADDGQAVVYSTLFARERATLRGERPWFADYHAWREGRGALCPDVMALLNGERVLFATLMATIERLIEALKAWWVSIDPAAGSVLVQQAV